MSKTLVILGHTRWADSKVNRALIAHAQSAQDVAVRNLAELYKDGKIDASAEIAAIQKVDKVVFQFPLFWFSIPSILKEWQDVVLTGILYGPNKEVLKGKKFQIITTAGGAKDSYDGHHGYTLDGIFLPIKAAFEYLGCEALKPYAIFGAEFSNLPVDTYLSHLK